MPDLVLLKNFSSYSLAVLAKNILEENGIICLLQKGKLAVSGEFTGAIGDMDIFVETKNLVSAKEILDSYQNDQSQ